MEQSKKSHNNDDTVDNSKSIDLEAVEDTQQDSSEVVSESQLSDVIEVEKETEAAKEEEKTAEVEVTEETEEIEKIEEVEEVEIVEQGEAVEIIEEVESVEEVIAEQDDNKDLAEPIELDLSVQKNIWFERLYPVGILGAICLVATILLSVTNMVTASVIAENTLDAEQEAMQVLFSDDVEFVPIELNTEQLEFADRAFAPTLDGEIVGYLVFTSSKGYGGEVPVIVSFDAEANLMTVSISDNSETPGIGDRIYEESFLSQFVGVTAEVLSEEYVAISGATYSSNAVYESVNKAIAVINSLNKTDEE